MPTIEGSWYDYPQYYDLAFQNDTKREADFFEAAFERYARRPVERVLEPACGTGRLVVEMARRGYDVVGFDLAEPSLEYLRRRLKRRNHHATILKADMTDFQIRPKADAAFCTVNTFRHLLTEADAQSHLEAVARAVRVGGLYILGLHVFPPDTDPEGTERWSVRRGRTRITVTLRSSEVSRRKRLEQIKLSVRLKSPSRDMRLRDSFLFRTYTARQLKRLFKKVPQWELVAVFDFWYDIDDPLALDEEIADTVCVLRRRRGI